MNELIKKLRSDFQDPEYRHSYAEECLNTIIATQIKVLREQRGMTQGELAQETGMRQPRIPLLEDSNYSNWTVNTLKRFAKAFDVALSVKFETFSCVVNDFENMSREGLERPTFVDDVNFRHRVRPRYRRVFRSRRQRRTGYRGQGVFDFAPMSGVTPAPNRMGAKRTEIDGNADRELMASGPVVGFTNQMHALGGSYAR